MKTTIKAKIVFETDKFADVYGQKVGEILTLEKMKEIVNKGEYTLEWINSELQNEQEPTLIIKQDE